MNCFYTCYNRIAILVFVLCMLGLQGADACITPKPVIYGKDTVCENSVELYKLIPAPDQYKFELKIVAGNGNSVALSMTNYAEVNWTKPGPSFIRYIYTDKNGCSDSVTKTVFVKPSDYQFDAGPDIAVCAGDSVLIGQPQIPGFIYRWNTSTDFVVNFPWSVVPINTSAQFIYARFRFNIFFKVVATDTNTGCRYVDTIWVKVSPRYKTKITGTTGCVNDSTIYTYTTDSLPYNARWEIEGGEILSGNKARSVQVKWNRIGKNKLILHYFTGDCKDSTFIETGLSAVKQPFYAGADGVACHKDTIILGMPPIPNCTYRWDDSRAIHIDGFPIYFTSFAKIEARGISTGIFVITYKVTLTDTISGCKFIDTVKLTVKPRLKTNITGTVGCYKEIATFTIDTLPADAYWFAEGGEIISDNKAKSIFVRWNRNGTNNVKLRYNHKGCTDSAVYIADVDSLTHFPITGADSIFENTTHTYTVENLSNTTNKWLVTGGNILAETNNTITVSWGNLNPQAQIQAYKVNDKGCFSDTSLLPVFLKKRENLDLSHTFHVYPNPFGNYIYIAPVNDFSGEISIELTDMLGRKLHEQTAYIPAGKNAFLLDVSALQILPGLYHLSVLTAQETTTFKMLKK